jgi:putative flavoprotein involved in K+ transport
MSATALKPAAPGHYPVIIIGGGQAGLSLSWYMAQHNIGHLVLERGVAFHAWKHQRWDSFCLVTPNWQCQLPGYSYAGKEPHGFMVKSEIIDFVEGFRDSFDPPILEGVEVTHLTRKPTHFALETTAGAFTAGAVCIATGGYHTPITPRMAERLPPRITQLHANEYRNPAQLPPGAVLVVGTGQSGCQIAEDLHLAGRQVHLCVGGAPRVSRFYRGRDVVDWLQDMGHYDLTVADHPMQEGVRGKANHYVTGRDGGRDIDLRKFAMEGMQLHGHMENVSGETIGFSDDLKRNLDEADRVNERIKDSIDQFIAKQNIAAPEESRYIPLWHPPAQDPPVNLASADVNTIIWCVGYAPDFSWVHVPVFTGRGAPTHLRGVTAVPGMYFLGLPWLNSWGSGRFAAIARDSEYLANHIAERESQMADLQKIEA